MRVDEFRAWLEAAGQAQEGIATRLANCKAVERWHGDLDTAFDRDRCATLLSQLAYTAQDKASGKPNPSLIPINGDLNNGLATYRSAITLYVRFRDDTSGARRSNGLTREAVLAAMDECDSLGLEAFLRRYAFGVPRDYWVKRPASDTRYPAKAIVGVAHSRMPGGKVRNSADFSGGNGSNGANTVLRALGFEIVEAGAPYATPPVRTGTADQIRQFVIAHYFEPARHKGEVEVVLVSGAIHRDMGLENAMPNVCQVLDGKLLAAEAQVELINREGPPAGSTARYTFSLVPSSRVREGRKDFAPMPEPTNLILYGPPGTGKTYRTAFEAVQLCDGEAPEDRAELMARYAELVKAERIGFVTFHQSFSYEDFVEGLRPVTNSVGEAAGEGRAAPTGFSLEPQDGIFKLMADLAASNRGHFKSAPGGKIDRASKVFKMSLGRSWASEDDAIFQDAIRDGYVVLGWGGDIDWSDKRFDEWAAIKERWREDHPDASSNDPNISQMVTFRINMQVGSLVVISDGNRKFRAIGEIKGPYQFVAGPNGEYNHRRSVRWLWHGDKSLPRELVYEKELSQVSAYQLNSRNIKWDGLEQIIAGGDAAAPTSGTPDPHVLIIDEINRANVSKVFGELITLIEPDKRLGMANALEVRLPYSKQDFGVPANLHIIGTMNTADRSVALLDTALRRRFRFVEVAPDATKVAEMVDGVALRQVFEAINARIEYLLDRDHCIGHALFMGAGGDSRAAIHATMRDKVIPLLQEYFFEDWSRIAAIVGKGFLEEYTLQVPTAVAAFGGPKSSWRVRDPFPDNACAILLSKDGQQADATAETPLEDEQHEA